MGAWHGGCVWGCAGRRGVGSRRRGRREGHRDAAEGETVVGGPF